MSEQKQKTNAASFIKYGIIGALLLVAPIALVNQIVLPMVGA